MITLAIGSGPKLMKELGLQTGLPYREGEG